MNRFTETGRTLIGCCVLVALALGTGCDEKTGDTSAESSAAEPTAKVPEKGEIAEEVAKGVDDVVKKRGPKWVVDYSGALSGTVEGGIMSVVTVGNNTTAAGGAMTEDRKGKAPQSFRAMIMRYGDTPSVQMKLTLADGTKCSGTPDKSSVKITDEDRKTFAANIKGTLQCDGDKSITYEAKLDKDP